MQASVSPPKEVFIDFINFLADLLGQKGALHDVRGDGRSDGVDKSEVTHKGESFGLPRSQFVTDLGDDKIKSSFVSLVCEYGYSKIFS